MKRWKRRSTVGMKYARDIMKIYDLLYSFASLNRNEIQKKNVPLNGIEVQKMEKKDLQPCSDKNYKKDLYSFIRPKNMNRMFSRCNLQP